LPLQLSEIFEQTLELEPSNSRSTVISVSNAGNWKALVPIIREKLPNIKIDPRTPYPIVIGQSYSCYLRKRGMAGMKEFKKASQLLKDNDKVVVFDAQRIQCLQSDPGCVGELIALGRITTFYFRSSMCKNLAGYLRSREDVDWQEKFASDDSISIVATKLSSSILRDEFKKVCSIVTADERAVLESMRAELLETLAPEIEEQLLDRNFGVPKLKETARRRIASALLRATTPSYSIKSNRDPIEFFREELSQKFSFHELPVAYLNEASPNLSYVIKSQKRFGELHLA
jgi:hypothetical protein